MPDLKFNYSIMHNFKSKNADKNNFYDIINYFKIELMFWV